MWGIVLLCSQPWGHGNTKGILFFSSLPLQKNLLKTSKKSVIVKYFIAQSIQIHTMFLQRKLTFVTMYARENHQF